MRHIGKQCPVITKGLEERRLVLQENGQGSPCLDLTRVSLNLIKLVEENNTDLVILEGMGRAIHTNLYSKFNTEVFKLAVIKNQWLAQRLGGELFSVIASYERPLRQLN